MSSPKKENVVKTPKKADVGAGSFDVVVKLADDQLTTAQVQNLLDMNAFVARFATGNRDLGRSLNVLMKIYRCSHTEGVDREVKGFYRCSWCLSIFKFMPKNGTQPMLRHIDTCEQRPEGYELPLVNEHLRSRNGPVVPKARETETNAPVGDAPNTGSMNVDANQNSPKEVLFVDVNAVGKSSTQTTEQNDRTLNITKASLAKLLAVANQVGAAYCGLNENDFSEILESMDSTVVQPIELKKLTKAKALAKMGVRQPRVNLDRLQPDDITENVPLTEENTLQEKSAPPKKKKKENVKEDKKVAPRTRIGRSAKETAILKLSGNSVTKK